MNKPWPMVPLREILCKSDEWSDIEPDERYREVTVRLWGKGVVQRREVVGVEISTTRRRVVRSKQFILSRIDARNGAFGLIPDSLDGAIVSNDFPVFNLNLSRIIPRFLEWMSKTEKFVDLCRKASEGTTNRVRLKEDRFLEMKISIPPLSEQRRIVERIGGLAGKVEEAQGRRQEGQEMLGALMSSYIMQLLEKVSVDGVLGDVLLKKPRNGWSFRCNNLETGIPVLSLRAVTGFHYRETEFKRTSEPTMQGTHYWLKKGDFLITRSNTPELVGHAAIYNGTPAPCIYPDLMMKLEFDANTIDPCFVWYWLQTPVVRKFIRMHAKGTSPTMKKISQGNVMEIPFPTSLKVSDQRRIVEELDTLQTKVDALKNLQVETAAELDAMLPSILDKAFKGEF